MEKLSGKLLKHVQACEGAEAILREGPVLAHVRVQNIQLSSKRSVRADLIVIQTLPAGFDYMMRQFDDDSETGPVKVKINIQAHGLSPFLWEIPQVGMSLYFDPKLIRATVDYCNNLPENLPPVKCFIQTVNLLNDLRLS